MAEQKTSVDIPSLLIKAGLVSTHDLSEAIQVSKRLRVPVSQVILTSGACSKQAFLFALDLQLLMDEKLINLESAVSSLRRVAAGKSTQDQVLDEIYSLPKFGQDANAVGELLKLSGIVAGDQIEEALKESAQSGSTLNSVLILRGTLSAGFFPAIRRVQDMLKEGKISKDEAVRQLQEEHSFWKKAEESQRFATLQAESLGHLQELAEKQRTLPHPPEHSGHRIASTRNLVGDPSTRTTKTQAGSGLGWIRADQETIPEQNRTLSQSSIFRRGMLAGFFLGMCVLGAGVLLFAQGKRE